MKNKQIPSQPKPKADVKKELADKVKAVEQGKIIQK